MDIAKLPVIGKRVRARRIKRLVAALGEHEAAMRDICAALLELTDQGDDLAVEVARILQALEG